jgi:hypothetical protein
MRITFDSDGNLEPGEHALTWDEFCQMFGGTPGRDRMLVGLKMAAISLKTAGSRRMWVDGSFVTRKEQIYGVPPSDFDVCWDVVGVDPTLLDPVILDFNNQRARQKMKFGGEMFPANLTEGKTGRTFYEFFQVDKNTGKAKGIIVLDLRNLS